MNSQWPVIITAAIGVAGTLTASWIGFLGGRRQTIDQATVEHGQWLRGQRQEAYMELFTAWDTAIRDLTAFQDGWDELVGRHEEADGEDLTLWAITQRETDRVWSVLRPRIERCELLGPNGVNQAAHGLYDGWRETCQVLRDQAFLTPSVTVWETWNQALGTAAVGRGNFQVACMQALRTPPSPEAEELYG